jgi:transcriptional regulator with XRE-family HTH domain
MACLPADSTCWTGHVVRRDLAVSSPTIESGSAGGPTVLRILLGAQLRRLREAHGVSREDAGWEIRSSESKISRIELGRVRFKERDIADLLSLYGMADDDPERDRLLALAREANAPGWWQPYGDVMPGWFQPYLGLEAATSLIRTYEVQFVPGLLQTREYGRAVIRLGHPRASESELERRVELRVARQKLLTRADPPQFWAVVDEAALRRPIGGAAVLRQQVEALIEATKLPNVRLQIVPFEVGGHAAAGGAFTILRFPERDLSDIVYVEQLTSALYLDRREDLDLYAEAMERLCLDARPPGQTEDTLIGILKDLSA